MSYRVKFIGALVTVLFASSSYAALIIDQNQANFPVHMAAFSQQSLAQSFQQANNNIAGAGIRLEAGIGTTDTVTISLWDALPNQLGANMLASASGVATAGSFFDVFWSPTAIATGVTYFLEFTSLNNTLGIAGDTNNPYAFGQVYANSGFGSFPTFDYTFRTYFETNQQQVPEPGTLALLGLGIAGAVFSRRRTKA